MSAERPGRGAPPIDARCRVCRKENGEPDAIHVYEPVGRRIYFVGVHRLDEYVQRRIGSGEIDSLTARLESLELDGTRALSIKSDDGKVIFSDRVRIAERIWI